jgi:hypothetical protein
MFIWDKAVKQEFLKELEKNDLVEKREGIIVEIKPWNFGDIFWTVLKFQVSIFLCSILVSVMIVLLGLLIGLFGFALPAWLSRFA